MDAISSQANLAGYVAVILAANRMNTIFPMMMTPAGTISPAKVFVLGIGVAGLQAIATAKRLGARVTAFDVRPEALEQAESLGAKASASTSARPGRRTRATPRNSPRAARQADRRPGEGLRRERRRHHHREGLRPQAAHFDQGRRRRGMKPGSLIVDLAAETGGNVEGIVPARRP